MAWTTVITDQAQSHYSYFGNAQEIWNAARNAGCTEEAAAGLLGNIEAESYCNPGQFEIGKQYSLRWGMGLIQWTPTQSYWDQFQTNPIVAALGDSWSNGALQVSYIFGGDRSGWIPTSAYNFSFDTWMRLTDISTATRAYFANRERGTWSNARLTYANHWYEVFTGTTPPEPPEPPEPSEGKNRAKEFLLFLIKRAIEVNS